MRNFTTDMHKTLVKTGLLVVLGMGLNIAISVQTDCPADRVCLTRDQAAKYLTMEDTVKAQEAEILALKKAVLDQKEVTVDVKIELARTVGELTAVKQAIVRCDADKEMLIKFGRVRKFGLINF